MLRFVVSRRVRHDWVTELELEWELKKFRNFYQKIGLIQDLLYILRLNSHFSLASILVTQDGFFIMRIFSPTSKQNPVSLLYQLCRHFLLLQLLLSHFSHVQLCATA